VADGDTDAVIDLYRRMHPAMNPSELLIEITSRFEFLGTLGAARRAQIAAGARAGVHVFL
jgi:hypothetical protein